MQQDAAVDTPENNALQQVAAADNKMQGHAAPEAHSYTISVEQVREHLRGKGLTKSKDTIQRWCRAGDLDCQKLGLLGRYFTTETSLLALESKLLPDMMAEDVGASAVKSVAADDKAARIDMPVHAAVDEPASNKMQVDEVDHAGARSDLPVNEVVTSPNASEELATLRAENSGLKEQLAEAKENAKFLREEIVSARGQRGDVVKIAEQMLGTLETMAVGGRLDRSSSSRTAPDQSTETVHFEAVDPNADRV